MMKFVKHFARDDERGNVAIIFALAMLPMMGLVGAAVDYTRLSLTKEKLRSVADSAAIAGATAMMKKMGDVASVQEAAGTAAATAIAEGQAPSAQDNVTATASQKSVKVDLTQTESTIFGGFVGRATAPVSATSTAVYTVHPPCMTILEPSANGILLNSDSSLNSNCKLHVNSTSSHAIQLNSSSKIKAQSTCVVGSVFNNGGTIEPSATTGCGKVVDPLKNLAEPTNANNACDHTNIVVQPGHSRTLNPGVYCTKFDVNGGAVTLNPGIYIIRDMELVVNQQGKLLGNDVMLYFMGKSGRLVLNSDSTLNISGRTSGTYQGMLIFQSRDPITLQTSPFIVNSSGSMKTEGTIYMPNGSLQFNDSGITNLSSAWTVIVVRALHLNSLAKLIVNTSSGGPKLPLEISDLKTPEGVRVIN